MKAKKLIRKAKEKIFKKIDHAAAHLAGSEDPEEVKYVKVRVISNAPADDGYIARRAKAAADILSAIIDFERIYGREELEKLPFILTTAPNGAPYNFSSIKDIHTRALYVHGVTHVGTALKLPD